MSKHKVRGNEVLQAAPQTDPVKQKTKAPVSHKNEKRSYIVSVLLVAAALCITLISAVHYFFLSADSMPADDIVSVFLAVLSLISWAAVLFLSYLYKLRHAVLFSSVLWWACFISFLVFCLTNTTNALSDGFFQLLLMVFTVPSWAYVSIVQAFGQTSGIFNIIMSLIPAFLFAASSTAVFILTGKDMK